MTRAPDPRLDLHNLGPLSREDAAALLDSLPRDPLYVPEDALVERRGGPTERRARRRGHSTLALIAFLIAGRSSYVNQDPNVLHVFVPLEGLPPLPDFTQGGASL